MADSIETGRQPGTYIPDGVIETEFLSPMAKLVLIIIYKHRNNKSRAAYPGIKTIARMAGIGRTCAIKAIKDLKDAGILEVKQRINDNGGRTSNLYIIHDDPEIWKAETAEEMQRIARASAAERLTDEELLEEMERRGFTILKGGQKDTKKGLPVLPDTESPDHRYSGYCERQDNSTALDRSSLQNNNITQWETTQVGKVNEICPNITKTHLIDPENRHMVGYDGLSEEPPAAALEAEEPTSRATGLPEEGGQAPMYTDEDVRALLDYDECIGQYEDKRELIDEILPIIRNVMNGRAASFRINGADVPAEVVRAQYAKLTLEHVTWAIENVERQASRTEIKNHDAYMRAALFDAPRQYRQRCRDHAAYYVMGEGQRAIAPPV